MVRRVTAFAAACIALAAASARAQSDQVVLTPTVLSGRALPANAITTFTVACRAGFVAVSAGVTSPAPGTTVLAIAPAGLAAYRFRIGNPAANGSQRVGVAVACRKLGARASAAYVLRLRTLKAKVVVVRPRSSVAATVRCPAGTAPAGGGFDLAPTRAARGFGGTTLSLRRETATLTATSFVVANSGSSARRVSLQPSCLTLLRTAGAPARRLHVSVTTFRVPLRPGAQTLARSCRRGWFALDAGFALHARTTSVEGAAVSARGGRWRIAGTSAGALVDVQLACGRIAR